MVTIEYFQEKISEKEKSEIMGAKTVVNILQEKSFREIGIMGEAFLMSPENQGIVLDFTTKMGACSNVYYSFVYGMPKLNYRCAKVSESMAVSPTHLDTYNILVGQKQKIEGQIKQGLASAMQAVTDYELLRHDERRYREIIDYFKKGVKDDHVLRNLFVDRVDAYTGEGYSMITMAKRWPTIINDFIRMGRIIGEEKKKGVEKPLSGTNDIEKKLDVPLAEATVLHTKNELFEEWKQLFRPVVQERYARIKAMADSRKKSINQYKEWLKPYVARHKAMEEADQHILATNHIYSPSIGTSIAFTGVRLWGWKPFPVEEKRKPESFNIKEENLGFPINPFDDFAKEWIAKINVKYGTNYTDEEIINMINNDFTMNTDLGSGYKEKEVPGPWMSRADVYYIMFDINLERNITKTPPPEGGEIENMMLNPLRIWLMSHNILLVHLVELRAIEARFSREIDEMVGAQSREDDIFNDIRKEMDEAENPPEEERVGVTKKMRNFVNTLERKYRWLLLKSKPYRRYFFKPGPYESNFAERVTKLYLVGSGNYFGQLVSFWKGKFNVK